MNIPRATGDDPIEVRVKAGGIHTQLLRRYASLVYCRDLMLRRSIKRIERTLSGIKVVYGESE